jgi:hypothetical protein
MPMETLPEGMIAALERATAYPDDASGAAGIEHVQTHLSHLFLSAQRVYKLRKAVAFGFVDFSSRARRNADCVNEVALNRRLAPDVYLGLAPVRTGAGGYRIGPVGDAPDPDSENAVVMRRLPAGRDALSLLAAGRLSAAQLDGAALRIARFHDASGLGAPAPFAPDAWIERIAAPLHDNVAVLARAFPGDPRVAALAARAQAFEREHAPRLERRRLDGRAVDGHGDLHLAHLWYEAGDEPCIIDCVEFDADLRRTDAAADLAFLVMDLAYRGQRPLAERVARVYAAARDDYDLYGVLDYFVSYRASVRAKVAALAAEDPELPAAQRSAARTSALAHLALAATALQPPGPGRAIATCGSVGTGKSSAAAVLADACGGVIIATDRVRKAGGAAGRAAASWGEGRYAPEARAAVYADVLERAEPVVRSGRIAILDATWSSAARRTELRRWAAELGIEVRLLELTCPADRVRERLARRAAEGHDPSDAGPDLVDASRASFEPPAEWPEAARACVDTASPGWQEQVRALAAGWYLG